MTDTFTDNARDPDIHFYNQKLQELDSEYYSVEKIIKFSEKLNKETLSIFHLHIRSLNKNMDKMKSRNQLQKHSSNYAMCLIIFKYTYQ